MPFSAEVSAYRGALSAYRGATVLFKFMDVFVAAEQMVARLEGGFCCAASFNAYSAIKD